MVRKLRLSESESNSRKYVVDLWNAYLDDTPYTCACCGKKFPSVEARGAYIDGQVPDGMHFCYTVTGENRMGNSINYDPYHLPKEDSYGALFKVVVSPEDDDEGFEWKNFCRNCWPKLTKYTPEELGTNDRFKTVSELDY